MKLHQFGDIISLKRYRRDAMAALLVRNLPDEVHTALKARAMHHSRSTEAEVRAILTEAVREDAPGLGSLLVDIGQSISGVEIEFVRDPAPYEPISFS
jgi:plasmid stability protein